MELSHLRCSLGGPKVNFGCTETPGPPAQLRLLTKFTWASSCMSALSKTQPLLLGRADETQCQQPFSVTLDSLQTNSSILRLRIPLRKADQNLEQHRLITRSTFTPFRIGSSGVFCISNKQLILDTHNGLHGSRISLTGRSAKQLPIHPRALVELGQNHVKPSLGGYLL